jgi:hypothetical protein
MKLKNVFIATSWHDLRLVQGQMWEQTKKLTNLLLSQNRFDENGLSVTATVKLITILICSSKARNRPR